MNSPIEQIKQYCNGQWDSVIETLTGFSGKPTHCPKHGGKSGKAFYGKRGKYADQGTTFCNTCGCNHDGINSLVFITERSYSEVVKMLIDYMGGLESTPEELEKMKKRQEAQKRKQAYIERKHFYKALNDIIDLVKSSEYLNDARQYFINRGLKPLANCYYQNIRFIRNAEHYENGVMHSNNAIIGIMRNLDNKIRNVQRIFLDDAFNKADCENPKKMMPSPKEGWHSGSAIWMKAKFNQMPGVVHVSEGFENGHAVLSQAPLYVDMACCLTAGNLARFDIPSNTQKLIIWADNDGDKQTKDGDIINVGIDSAKQLKERAKAMGIEAVILAPKEIGDWNDYPERCKAMWNKLISILEAA